MAPSDSQWSLAFPNVEGLLITFLGGRPELSAVRVLLRLPADDDGSPAVVVSRMGGEFDPDDHLDRAVVRVDTYAAERPAALDLTGTVRSLIWSLPDGNRAGVVVDVAESRGPSLLRDPAYPMVKRYTTRYVLTIRIDVRNQPSH